MSPQETDPALVPWVLIGPTASGKSSVALRLAERHGMEIVSVDSMQVYRGMDIGTAKPTADERSRVPHHMIDVFDPGDRCNVGRFCRMARRCIQQIRERGRRPFLVGGTALYLKGLIWGLAEAPPRDPELRRRLRRLAEEEGSEHLHRRLREVDPPAAEKIHPNDVQRLVRALEVCELSGQRWSDRRGQFEQEPRMRHVMVGLRWPRPQLYRRIEQRVDRMMERGLLQEVRELRGRLSPQSLQAVGYKELVEHLDGDVGLEEAVRRIKRNTRRFAKHQITWFGHFRQAAWVERRSGEGTAGAAQRVESVFARLLDTI